MKTHRMLLGATLVLVCATTQAQYEEDSAFIEPASSQCAALNDAGMMVYSNDTRITISKSKSTGATHLKCSFETTPTVSGKAWKNQGFLCCTFNPGTGLLFTRDSHIRQTPNGDMELGCHF